MISCCLTLFLGYALNVHVSPQKRWGIQSCLTASNKRNLNPCEYVVTNKPCSRFHMCSSLWPNENFIFSLKMEHLNMNSLVSPSISDPFRQREKWTGLLNYLQFPKLLDKTAVAPSYVHYICTWDISTFTMDVYMLILPICICIYNNMYFFLHFLKKD